MTTAWVLPGGTSLGAVQVGQAAALPAGGIEAELTVARLPDAVPMASPGAGEAKGEARP